MPKWSVLSDPRRDADLQAKLLKRMDELMLRCDGFTADPAPFFQGVTDGDEFIRRACVAQLLKEPVPADRLLTHLMGPDPRPANAIRRAQQTGQELKNLLEETVTRIPGGLLVGEHVLIPQVGAFGNVDCQLPPGDWTLLRENSVHRDSFRGVFSVMELPVLLAENTILSVEIPGMTTYHWFEPRQAATLKLPGGGLLHFREDAAEKGADRLIIHRDGEELIL